ncbi:MAG: ABC transporter substrate-binding protein [Spirochaetales bacterium]|nr:ABC transporter substrate-binding protein [Spirochaetales bacterium]
MKKIIPTLILTLFLGISVFAAQPEELILAIGFIPHVQFTPLYVGINKGFYAEEGIELRIEYGFGIDILALLHARKIDMGLTDSDQLIIAGEKGLDLKAFFQYYQSYPVSIVAKKEKITKPEDLIGKTIGVPALYGTSYIGLLIFLDKYGLKDKVKIQKTGYAQIPALIGDKVDAAVVFYNNETIQLRQMGHDLTVWNVREISDVIGASFMSSGKILDEKENLLKKFNKATRKAIAYTIANKKESLEIAYKVIGQIKDEQKPFLEKVLDKTCELFGSPEEYGVLPKDIYARSVLLLKEKGIISKFFDYRNILYIAK